MGKIKIKLNADGSIEMETKGIKGEKCLKYADLLSELANIKIEKMKKTSDFYANDDLSIDDSQHLRDN